MQGMKIMEVTFKGHILYVSAKNRAEAAKAVGCSEHHMRNNGAMIRSSLEMLPVARAPGTVFTPSSNGKLREWER